jgi:hypothetical protein
MRRRWHDEGPEWNLSACLGIPKGAGRDACTTNSVTIKNCVSSRFALLDLRWFAGANRFLACPPVTWHVLCVTLAAP